MATPEAAEEVAAFLNQAIAHRSTVRRQHARMIITWTIDAAVNADKIGRHKRAGAERRACHDRACWWPSDGSSLATARRFSELGGRSGETACPVES
jgi:hypothetical protein